MTLQETIIEFIRNKPGIKGPDLVFSVLMEMSPRDGRILDHEEYFRVIESMVQEGKIVEVEYELPDGVPGRVKSMYFPRGTWARIIIP